MVTRRKPPRPRAPTDTDTDALRERLAIAESRVAALRGALAAVLHVRPKEFTKPETQAIYRQAMAVVEET